MRLLLLLLAGTGGLVVLVAALVLASMFWDSVASSDRVTGVALALVGVAWAALPVIGLVVEKRGHATPALIVWGACVAIDVVALIVIVVAVEAAARP